MAKIKNSLLKQAIADAEAVRETAIANAKLVLEEAITPQVKEMIARRLRVEADMEHAEEEMEDTPALKKDAPDMEEATEKPHEDGEAIGSSEMPADSSNVGAGDNTQPSDDASDESGIGDGGENVEDSNTDWYDDWNEADFDLGEIIKELENDIASLSGSEEDEAPMGEGEEEVDLADLDMEDDEEPVMEAKEEEEKEELKENEGEDEEEVSLEEILAELEAEEEPTMKEEGDDKKHMADKLAGLKNELAQYREAVKVLSGRLQEVNLLNAKLLFTNKIFRKEGLNSDQKVRIVESFDRATTVREVKLVYAALVENLSSQAKVFNKSRKKVMAEGIASKATPSTAPKSSALIVENTVARRLQELAGII